LRCVIAGTFKADGAPRSDAAQLIAATGDERASVIDLGRLRLAVSGPKASAARADGMFAALDGDIYNLPELAREARVAHAEGPARLLAVLHRRLGDGLLPRLRGDFALVLWDEQRARGILVRDQTAGRSLYYSARGPTLVFASEVKQLLQLLPSTPEPDCVSMAHWLNVSAPPGDRTLYSGVSRLRAGNLLRLAGRNVNPERYWAPRYEGTLDGTVAELAGGLREVLTNAVERRLLPGERTGLLLSGGLDSSAVAAIASNGLAPERRPTGSFSAVFPRHPSIDESRLIAKLARDHGLEAMWMEVRRGSLFPGALDYLHTWRTPPTSPNLFFWNPMFRSAADHGFTSLLDGEGGDQVFGLSPYLLADRLRRGRVLSAVKLARRMPGAGPKPPWRSVRGKLQRVGVRGALPVWVQGVRRSLSPAGRYALPWLLPAAAATFAETDDSWRWRGQRGPRWWTYLVNETTTGIGPALTLDHVRRRNTMSGITPRHPLLDVDVLEYMYRVPPETAYDWRFTRPLFRASLEGLLRDEIRLRPEKSSFDAIFHESLLGDDMPTIRRLVLGPDAEIRRYVDQQALRSGLLDLPPERYPGGLVWWALPVWRTTVAECFLRSLADPAQLGTLIAEARPMPADVRLRPAEPVGHPRQTTTGYPDPLTITGPAI
jgi:asparagine synthase (glutamine-hydrolysing)